MGQRQYGNVAAFRKEAKRVENWYSRQRRSHRRRSGPLRDGQDPHVRHSQGAVTKKVESHFVRLLKPLELEGLWAWAKVSKDLHKAGVPVLSGTLPVEMFWAGLVSMLPPQAKNSKRPRLVQGMSCTRQDLTRWIRFHLIVQKPDRI